jgi:aminopeptidase N
MRLLFLCLALLASSADAEDDLPGKGMDLLAYDIEVTPDFAERALSAKVSIDVESREDGLNALNFSRNEMTIDEVRLNGKPILATRLEKTWRFGPFAPVKKGQRLRLSLRYHGKAERGLKFGPQENGPATSVYSNYFACDWLFCLQDNPGDKAKIRTTLHVPDGIATLAAGSISSQRKRKGQNATAVWESKRPYSSYLISLAAGHWSRFDDGKQLTHFAEKASAEEMQARLATMPDMVAFFEAKAGLPLPVKHYHQLLVEGSEAQEAATHATIGRDEIDPILENPQEDWVIAHELAHMWWGNLVTAKNWDHFWLNEGITTFMVAAWKEHKFGRAAYDREMELARKRLGRATDAGFDKPLSFAGTYPNLGTRRAIQYSKGALFMDHLRTTLGDELFWKVLAAFIGKHAGDSVDSKDFQNVAEQISGRDLSATFEQWVYSGAKPTETRLPPQ